MKLYGIEAHLRQIGGAQGGFAKESKELKKAFRKDGEPKYDKIFFSSKSTLNHQQKQTRGFMMICLLDYIFARPYRMSTILLCTMPHLSKFQTPKIIMLTQI